MTYQNQPADPSAKRIRLLLTIGVTLLVTGAYSAFTLYAASFGRYMYVEGLWLDDSITFAVTRATPADKGLLVVALALVLLGLLAFASAAIRAVVSRLRRSTTITQKLRQAN